MPHFYRGSQAHVSHRVFEVWDPVWRIYAIQDLDAAWTVRRRKARGSGSASRACSTGAVGTVALVVVQGLLPGRGYECVAAVLVVLATAVQAIADSWRSPVCELWALHRGIPVRLIVSGDPRSFNQICRALQRALEWRRDAEA